MKKLLILTLIIITIFLYNENKKLKNIPPTIIEKEIYKNLPNKYIGEYKISFYTHTGNNTASGIYPKSKHTIAVDTNIIPMGSIIYIEGVGYRVAEDTGNNIKGNRLDVFVDNKEIAIKNGIQTRKVYLLN